MGLGFGSGLRLSLVLVLFFSRVLEGLGLGFGGGFKGPDLRKSESSKPEEVERWEGARPREEAKEATSDWRAARSSGVGFFGFGAAVAVRVLILGF